MKRAVVVFLENKRSLLMQFGCLYTSYKFISSKDTDFVVFGTPPALNKVPDDCIKVKYLPLKGQWNVYRYINSISCITGKQAEFLNEYDMILRTDADTFLTPAWESYYPNGYCVGMGKYALYDEVRRNILRVAKNLGLNHRGIHNIGSTHYGPPKEVINVSKMSYFIAEHIIKEEFHTNEGKWPYWYKGVTTMYSNEMSINHLLESFCIVEGKLDYYSTSDEPVVGHPHIHCWHTDEMFSKFQFARGSYNQLSLENLKLDFVNQYCLYMALKSRREMPWLG